jgi:hypothetical protein
MRLREPAYFNLRISEMQFMIRVKMKPITFNISCTPTINLKGGPQQLKIKIRRQDTDKTMFDCRVYLRRLIILANKEKVPTIYFAVDLSKYPKTHTWHILYALKGDKKCPFVNLRIIANKAEPIK